MRFVATADWQLGMAAWFLPGDARARFAQARLDAVRRIGRLAAERDAAFVLVCGDVFESNQLDRRIVAQAFEVLRSFTVPVVLLPGNHDPLDAASIYDSSAFAAFTRGKPDHVHVLRDSVPWEVVEGVEIVGAPLRSKHPHADLVAQACAPLDVVPSDVIRIIAGHGAVRSRPHDFGESDITESALIDDDGLRRVLDTGRAHVAVLGDLHSTTEVAPGIWYPGTPEVTARREPDPGNVIVVEVTKAGNVAVDKVKVGRWRFITVEERLASMDDVEALDRRIGQIPDKDHTAVWSALTGRLTVPEDARLREIIDEAERLFARFDPWDRHTDLAVVATDADFAAMELSGFAEAARAELAEAAEADGEAGLAASDALRLFFQLAGGDR
ncbi:MAG: DNA repair exonuclease [Bifidobacteriaceae bacterium]|jgi:DNA repair exonuclease SbcCD nuclease subunit|nr:DNA repair exonuclease [Bifidobacteriaceae bacterium]